MPFIRFARMPAQCILLALNLATFPVAAQDGAAGNSIDSASRSGSALFRAMHESAVKAEKMRLYLQPAMRRNGIDMWIIMSREFHPDPVLDLFGGYGITGWCGHHNAGGRQRFGTKPGAIGYVRG